MTSRHEATSGQSPSNNQTAPDNSRMAAHYQKFNAITPSTVTIRAHASTQHATNIQTQPRNHGFDYTNNFDDNLDWEQDDVQVKRPFLDSNTAQPSFTESFSSSTSPSSSSPFHHFQRSEIKQGYYKHIRKRLGKQDQWWKDRKTMAKLIGGALSLITLIFLAITCLTDAACSPFLQCAPYDGRTLAVYEMSVDKWVKNHANSNLGKQIQKRIAHRPMAIWIGDWIKDPRKKGTEVRDTAKSQHGLYTVVVYSIPNRDCGQYSKGGANNIADYDKWITELAGGLNDKDGGIVILEPDALILTDCLSEQGKADRFHMLKKAVLKLKAAGGRVYIDAGHANWLPADQVAARLKKAGVEFADGFALNTANGVKTDRSITYGNDIVNYLHMRKGFVIDVSRNGAGAATGQGEDAWCNPPSLRLGREPTLSTKNFGCNVHALLWVKPPGESDGSCRGNPPAGKFSPELAKQLLA